MRLRRETGDFQIVMTPTDDPSEFTFNSIRPGLSAEDFVGEVVKKGDKYISVVTSMKDGDDVTFTLPDDTPITYVPATGELYIQNQS